MPVAELSDVAGVQQGVEFPEGSCKVIVIVTDNLRAVVEVRNSVKV